MHTIATPNSIDTPSHHFTEEYFKAALGRFPTGVAVITTAAPENGEPIGLTVSSFNSVSLNPPLVLWSLAKTASTLPHFMHNDQHVIHILSAQQLHLAKQFAYGPQPQRFRGQTVTRAPGGALMLSDAHCAAWFECRTVARHEAGDHIVLINQVLHCERQFLQPLVYHAGDFDLTPSIEPIVQG